MTNASPPANNPPATSAGQMLRQAREQRQLSVQQVAQQLNLRPELISKLEQDQLDGTLQTFARGYVRAYGRLMKLPEAQLMAAFICIGGAEQTDAKPMRTFSNRTAKQATENRFMWLTYAIGVLLLLLLFIWWWQTARVTVADNTAKPATLVDATAPADAGLPADIPQQVQPDVTATEQQAEPIPEPQAEPTSEQLEAMLEQLVPTQTPAGEQATPLTTEALAQLEMRFSENCWVDVVDADGNRVAYGTKQAGYIMQLSGKAPFVVTLGNPSVVNINFNQQAVDMSALPAGRVAKFTIPESE